MDATGCVGGQLQKMASNSRGGNDAPSMFPLLVTHNQRWRLKQNMNKEGEWAFGKRDVLNSCFKHSQRRQWNCESVLPANWCVVGPFIHT